MKDRMKALYKEGSADERTKLRGAFKDDAELSKAFDECDSELNKAISFEPDAIDALLKSLQDKTGVAAPAAPAQAPDILAGTSAARDLGDMGGVDPNDNGLLDPLPVFDNISKALGEQNEAVAFVRKGIVGLAQRSTQERDLLAKAIGQLSTVEQTNKTLVDTVAGLVKSVEAISTRLGMPAAAPRGVTTHVSQVLPTRADATAVAEDANKPAVNAGERLEKSLNLAMTQGNATRAEQLRQFLLHAQDGRVTEAHLQQIGVL